MLLSWKKILLMIVILLTDLSRENNFSHNILTYLIFSFSFQKVENSESWKCLQKGPKLLQNIHRDLFLAVINETDNDRRYNSWSPRCDWNKLTTFEQQFDLPQPVLEDSPASSGSVLRGGLCSSKQKLVETELRGCSIQGCLGWELWCRSVFMAGGRKDFQYWDKWGLILSSRRR